MVATVGTGLGAVREDLAGGGRRCQTTRSSCTRSLSGIRVALHQVASEARDPAPAPRAPERRRPISNVQVIVEIEARAATVERLFMISEQQEWTFGETLEYALDAIELALAKTATG